MGGRVSKCKPVGYVAVGTSTGRDVYLFPTSGSHGHTGTTKYDVEKSIMDRARKEGFNGTLAERLAELEWVIKPVYALDEGDGI